MQHCEIYYIMNVMLKMKAKTPLLLTLGILFAAVVFFFLSLEFRDKKLESFSDRIRNLEEMVTARQIYRNVIYTEIKENLIVDKRSLFTINYIVTAGVDFSSGINIEANNNTIQVSYPFPQIISIDADESSIDEYFTLERFGKLKQSDYLDIIYDEKDRIRKDALSGGILERADKNLQSLITGILKEGGLKNIRFDHIYSGVNNEDA